MVLNSPGLAEIFKRVSLARDWMDAHYNNNITLEDIAAPASMNSQHFLRMFKQVYHITPHQYLIDLKLKKAKQLLVSSGLTMAEICQTIGLRAFFPSASFLRTVLDLPLHISGKPGKNSPFSINPSPATRIIFGVL